MYIHAKININFSEVEDELARMKWEQHTHLDHVHLSLTIHLSCAMYTIFFISLR